MMINIHEQFLTLEAAKRFITETYRRYHPAGYGTSLRISTPSDKQTVDVVGYRFASCD